MSLDYGEKRVGVALSDESLKLALPHAVWSNDKHLLGKVLELKRNEHVQKVVMGESKNLKGQDNPLQKEVRKFRDQLEDEGVEVVFHPEIFTTMEAKRLQGRNKMTDASAAALILKSFIETVYNKTL